MSKTPTRIERTEDLTDYFRRELQATMAALGLEVAESTEAYLAHLLEGYARVDAASRMEVGFFKPAAFMLSDALEARGDARIDAYRRLGDACLYSCGFFDRRLSRRNIDLRYYSQLGQDAYAHLDGLMRRKAGGSLFSEIFEELAVKFDDFVSIFKRLGGRSVSRRDDELELLLRQLQRGEHVEPERLIALGLLPGLVPKA